MACNRCNCNVQLKQQIICSKFIAVKWPESHEAHVVDERLQINGFTLAQAAVVTELSLVRICSNDGQQPKQAC